MSTQASPETVMLLQSKDHGALLNTIDDLRSRGVGRYIDLPQLVVCGDQSSGKSSVLEAVSGIPFPRKDNLCTRFATEVILRRSQDINIKISVVPTPGRSPEEKERMLKFQRQETDLDDFEALLEEAKLTMGVDDQTKFFSQDVLRVELSGPSQPHLTLVDLPGLFSAGSKIQSDEDAENVESLVLSYMRKRRSIILAVVSAKNDFANQKVTRHARMVDHDRYRTLGIITKPDALDIGSDTEKSFVDMANNKDVNFRLGWHVLRNRGFDTRDTSTEQRDDAEARFFSQGIWTSLPRRQVGVVSLRPRLATLLRDQILNEVPDMIKDVEKGMQECEEVISKLGKSRSSLQEQRLYLLGVSQNFTTLIRSAVEGVYNDAFFGSAKTELGYKKRLQAVVTNELLEFAKVMREKGHAKHIVAHAADVKRHAASNRYITRSDFVREVVVLMRRSRGCELPGTYNPSIIGELFREQSQPWQPLVDECTDKIWQSIMMTLDIIIDQVSDDLTASAVKRLIITPRTETIKKKLTSAIAQVLKPHRDGHPITYNHYFTDNVQKIRMDWQKKLLATKLDDLFGTNFAGGEVSSTEVVVEVDRLFKLITTTTLFDDMDSYACSEAIDCMRAYYKVAIKNVIDQFAALAVDDCLQSLPEVFSPQAAMSLDDATISKIAAETEESKQERHDAEEKLEALQKALDIMRSLQPLRPNDPLGKWDDSSNGDLDGNHEIYSGHVDESHGTRNERPEDNDERYNKNLTKFLHRVP